MATVRNSILLHASLTLVILTGVTQAQLLKPTAGTNLARGKACTFDPKPSYPGCTDTGDRFDLTDGIYNGCLWTNKGTVGLLPGYGWDVETMPIFLIDIDLGVAQPISKITFSSIAGMGGVTFPLAVRVFVSTDGKHYHLLCNMLTNSVPQDKQVNHRFIAQDLKGWGRHVRFALLPGGPMMFFDEIEIMAGKHTRQEVRHLNQRPIPAGMVKTYARQMRRGTPDLWTYSGFGSDRGQMHESGAYYCEGLLGLKTKQPKFYQTARAINALLIRKSFLDEKLRVAKRAQFYAANLVANRSPASRLSPRVAELVTQSSRINIRLNELYQFYGRAFDANRNAKQLSAASTKIKAVAERIKRLERETDVIVSQLRTAAASTTGKWQPAELALSPDDKALNKNGFSRRFQFTAFHGAHLDDLWALGPFDGYHIDHPIPWPISNTPGQFRFPKLKGYIDRIIRESNGRIKSFSCTEPSYRGDVIPMTEWMLAKAKKDPNILLQTEKGKRPPLVASTLIGKNSRLNVQHPAALNYIRGYLKNLAAQLSSQTKLNYFITAWEGSAGHVGYNRSSQSAFQKYLQERYGSIDTLNSKWGADHRSFQAIGIPYQQYTSPPTKVTGLTYEFERWKRVNYVRFVAQMRRFLQLGAAKVPVLSDPSHFLREGNTYLMYKEHACDIMSFHSYPTLEGPMWVYLESMNRTFGRTTGYFENYYGMWSRKHLSNERLAKRDLSKFFFKMFLRDVRVSAWWLGFHSHPTSYVTAYNGNVCGLNYDQTIYRWSATALPVMFSRCRTVEKALLESRQEVPTTAIIQPCASVFNLASLKRNSNYSNSLQLMFDLHNQLLAPENMAHDYLPEEMVLDGKRRLKDYRVLLLPYAPYMSQEMSRRLVTWVRTGGTLIAVGPFCLKDEFGIDLPAKASLYKTLFPKSKNLDAEKRAGQSKLLTTKRFGQGRVVCLTKKLDALMRNASMKLLLTEIIKAACHRTATSPSPDLEILVRDGKQGEKYLGLCNRNVEQPIETIVIVNGRYAQPKDLLIPGWFPVPALIYGQKTILRIRLEPGDWTLLRL